MLYRGASIERRCSSKRVNSAFARSQTRAACVKNSLAISGRNHDPHPCRPMFASTTTLRVTAAVCACAEGARIRHVSELDAQPREIGAWRARALKAIVHARIIGRGIRRNSGRAHAGGVAVNAVCGVPLIRQVLHGKEQFGVSPEPPRCVNPPQPYNRAGARSGWTHHRDRTVNPHRRACRPR